MGFLIDGDFLVAADTAGRGKMAERLVEKHGDIRTAVIARSILSRPIDAFYIGSGKKFVLIAAGHHALESITSNIAYLLMDYLLSKISSGTINGVDCKLLFSKYCFIIIPCINPDGIELRLHGADKTPLYDRQMKMSGGDFSVWQANARGVDLNHNYNYRFCEYKKIEAERGISAGATLYSGEYPESEPEARGAANLVRALFPAAVVSLHSQGEEIYAFPSSPSVRRIGERLAAMTGYSLSIPADTAAYGGLCDYTGSLGIPSFTLEVGSGQNPLPEGDVPAIFPRICKAAALLPTIL